MFHCRVRSRSSASRGAVIVLSLYSPCQQARPKLCCILLLLCLQVTVGDDEDAPLLKVSDPANNATKLLSHNACVYAALPDSQHPCFSAVHGGRSWTHQVQLLAVSVYFVQLHG